MNRPILFLDIDGVLNDHTWHQPADCTTIDKPCMDRLNKIIEVVDPDIILSTARRYMILNGAMTATGFFHMLRTHGLSKNARIVGLTHPDEHNADNSRDTRVKYSDGVVAVPSNRGEQIAHWLNKHGAGRRYCVVDDRDDLGIQQLHAANFIQTDKDKGMTDLEMDRVISMLKD